MKKRKRKRKCRGHWGLSKYASRFDVDRRCQTPNRTSLAAALKTGRFASNPTSTSSAMEVEGTQPFDWSLTAVHSEERDEREGAGRTAGHSSPPLSRTETALSTLVARQSQAVGRQFSSAEAVKLALAAAMREPMAHIEVLFGFRIGKELRAIDKAALAATPAELGVLFGPESTLADHARYTALQTTDGVHKSIITSIETSLHTTLVSERAAQAWRRPPVRCAAAISLRMDRCNEAFAAIVGEVQRSDARRMENTQFDLQDGEDASDAHLLSTCAAIEALVQGIDTRPSR